MHRRRSRLRYFSLFRPLHNFSVSQSGQGVIIVDAGGGTIDLSAYFMKDSPSTFEEIAPALCVSLLNELVRLILTQCIHSGVFQGSIYVTRRAQQLFSSTRLPTCKVLLFMIFRNFIGKLCGSSYSSPDDVQRITDCFDKSTKLTFKDPDQPSFIKFGTSRNNDSSVNIKMGRLKLQG
jgi:hypothetical protein